MYLHEKNMEKMFPTKKSIIFIIIINGNIYNVNKDIFVHHYLAMLP
jgi:hypothetical protein